MMYFSHQKYANPSVQYPLSNTWVGQYVDSVSLNKLANIDPSRLVQWPYRYSPSLDHRDIKLSSAILVVFMWIFGLLLYLSFVSILNSNIYVWLFSNHCSFSILFYFCLYLIIHRSHINGTTSAFFYQSFLSIKTRFQMEFRMNICRV